MSWPCLIPNRHLFFIAFFLLFAVTACEGESHIETPAAYPKKSDQIVLKMGHNSPATSSLHAGALEFAEKVYQQTNGKVKIKIFPNQEWGNDREMIEAARDGAIDIILPPTSKLTTLVPQFQILDLPYLFPNEEMIYPILDGEAGKKLLSLLKDKGLVGIAFWESGFKQFTANKLIRNPEDFKSVKTRIMKSRAIFDQFQSMGAKPIPIEFHSAYQALKEGVVEAQENPIEVIFNMKFYEVQSHLTLSNHAYLGQVLCISQQTFKKLTNEVQEVLIHSAMETTPIQRDLAGKNANTLLKKIKDYGVEIVELSPEELKRFKGRLQHLHEKHRPVVSTGLLELVLYELGKSKSNPNEDLVIGLDADLFSASALSGMAIKRGMEMAVEEINAGGGVLGKKLRIVARDHSGFGNRGLENINNFSKIKNLVAVMGGLHSPVIMAELETIHKKNIVMLDPWAAGTNVVKNGFDPNYVFRLSVQDEHAGAFLVDQALKKHSKVALLLENTAWGRSSLESIVKALANRNLAPVNVEWFNYGQTDFSESLTKIQSSNAEAMILVANAREGSLIVKALHQGKYRIPVISHWGISGGSFWHEVKEELKDVDVKFLQTFSFINSENEKTHDLIQKYKRKYSVQSEKEISAPVGTAHAYDLVHLLAKSIKKADSTNRADIRNALENLDEYKGLIKTYNRPFSPENHEALSLSDYFLAKFDDNGVITPIP